MVRARRRQNPRQRFVARQLTAEPELMQDEEPSRQQLTVIEDASRTILSRNDSPDLGFRWSLNPYRGCQHACSYCYARPTHEYLGLGAGTDFDSQLVVKRDAPGLLQAAFESRSLRDPDHPGTRGWQGAGLLLSGVTDCYQPLENRERVTRACLEVCLAYRNPVYVVTKSPLVERDLDLLLALNDSASAGVALSIPFLDEATSRALEPGVTPPARRFRCVERLAAAGLPVTVNISPLIPGLNDAQLPQLLARAADAGAVAVSSNLLRLPGAVKQVFVERLREAFPLRAEKVLARIREAHGTAGNDPALGLAGNEADARLYRADFGHRMRGEGPYARAMFRLFEQLAGRHRLQCRRSAVDWRDQSPPPGASTFRRPAAPARPAEVASEQLSLFR